MQNTKSTVKTKTVYKPVSFLSGTFLITWLSAKLMTFTDYNADPLLFTVLDFLENASPLICALFLLKMPLLPLSALKHFLFGKTRHLSFYLIVLCLFAAQFFNFYWFRLPESGCTVPVFLSVFAGQLLLGGGLEEAGWRGFSPALYPFTAYSHVT